ncbi:MAG: hypothetical protein QOF39_3411 [Frankiales bacterium]|nr:hypothetical protein [Frankiales bacterium]
MTTVGTYTTHSRTRSRSMLLIHEDLARARIAERLDQAEAARLAHIARARRARRNQSRVSRATSRARLLVAFGSTR